MSDYEPVIGLEIHAQLRTRTKLFCGCPAEFGADPNTLICPVCLGLPGALPVLNRRAVEFAVRLGVATECAIALRSEFARKNYFYPDCPKNYQITQYEVPICSGGRVPLGGEGGATVRIKRIHLEEDAGKLLHPSDDETSSFVDMNRAGIPLVEIVTEPDIRTAAHAAAVAQSIRSILRYLDICDGNMEEGSLRCDVNVSVRERGTRDLGVKTEIKNLNSFKAVESAIAFEIKRQETLKRDDKKVEHATLLWNAASQTCQLMRSKETAHDYRYFPEPDLQVLEVSAETVERIKQSLPELPSAREKRFESELGIPEYDARLLTSSTDIADYFELVTRECGDAKAASNWVMSEVLRELNERRIEISRLRVTPEHLGRLILMVKNGAINTPTAKDVFRTMAETGTDPQRIIADTGLGQIGEDAELDSLIQKVLDDNPKVCADYLAGKEKLFKWLLGQTMKASGGRANPKRLADRLEILLEKRRRGG
ncbi:MAG: Asp-tRNA(Asn)/Glu-tRNA(Gln) amidotransferase subunit GatB [Candidatus Latescibacterota bacterium]|nr:MAG: Asp-tRNA(Asn)/Glu-tRNA(Gln) amidotransferase subunit GatB [Candidatus Latescibacterota bacterium]